MLLGGQTPLDAGAHSYNAAMSVYVIKTAKLDHNHPADQEKCQIMYGTVRRPRPDLQQTTTTLLANGANPTLSGDKLSEFSE